MRWRPGFARVWLVVGVCACGPAAGADVSRNDRELVDRVWARLVAAAKPIPEIELAKTVKIIDDDTLNAYATMVQGKDDGGKAIAGVFVFRGLMEHVIRGSEDRMAFVLGHELSHVQLGHLAKEIPEKRSVLGLVFSRQQELEADRHGMIAMMRSGFSFDKGLEAYREFHGYLESHPELRLKYSSFEGLLLDHPSWTDRLALLDKDRRPFWRAMSAFESGVYFLQTEQYVSAERCFEAVKDEFPKSDEAWTNYGYCLLMQYCDKLEPKDLQQLGVGQLVAGGFFRRAAVLVPVRGVDDQIWHDAVEALNKARQLNPGQTMASANLGIAYLVHPSLKSDVEQAEKYLREAAAGQGDGNIKAGIAINLGVAELKSSRRDEAARLFKQAEMALNNLSPSSLRDALVYSQATISGNSGEEKQRVEAIGLLRRYLATANSSSAWYRLAYDQYAALSRTMGRTTSPIETFAPPPVIRPVTSIRVGNGITIVLSEPLDDLLRRIQGGQKLPVSPEVSLMRIRFQGRGFDILANDCVVAIMLNGANAPTLQLVSTAGQPAGKLHPGMATEEIDQILKSVPYDRGPLENTALDYRLYPDLGLALRISKGVVEEVVIVQVPRQVG